MTSIAIRSPSPPSILSDKQPRPLRAQGFTLVELLVGLTLMTLISILLFGGLRFGVRAWEAAGQRTEGSTRIELIQTLLRRQIAQARPTSIAPLKPVAAFTGQPDGVTFIASPVRQDEVNDDLVFVLNKVDANKRSHLDLTWRPLRPPSAIASPAGAETAARLIEDVAAVEIAYYGAPDGNGLPGWSDEWSGGHSLPSLVRLRVTFPQGDTRRWPDLIIRLVQASN
jgi:general secretion pathway protein J